MQDGALELEGGELSFETGPDGKPRKVEGKSHLPMMAVVAEMMIFANAAVAHRIAGAFPVAALLRRHAPPRPDGFDQVTALFKLPDHPFCFGYQLFFLSVVPFAWLPPVIVLSPAGLLAPLSKEPSCPPFVSALITVSAVLGQVRCWGMYRSMPRWPLVLPTTG